MDLKILAETNPWWVSKKVPGDLKGKSRMEYKTLLDSVETGEITVITGVRRSGKSTLMYQMIDHLLSKNTSPSQILFLNLENPKITQENLDEVIESYRQEINPKEKAYIFLDEVHKKEGWEKWIRSQYDLKKPVKFTISGSSSHLLKKEYSTLLTGRNLSFEVFPLTFKEYLSFKDITVDYKALEKGLILPEQKYEIINALNSYLQEGGFPAAVNKKEPYNKMLLAQYFDDIIYKDIVDRFDLNARKTRDLAQYLITNITNTLSLRNIRNTLGLSYESIQDYMSYYQDAFLLFPLEHFSYSMKEQKTRPSKTYCIDNGLRNAASYKFSEDTGRLAENQVFIELIRTNKNLYYWKDKDTEVDYIIKNPDQTLTAINVTYTDEIDERETKSLQKFKIQHKKTTKQTIITKNTEKTQNKIQYIPLWKWLLTKK